MMPPKKRRKIECLLCHQIFDNDHRNRHNETIHPLRKKNRQHIPFKDAGTILANPFEVRNVLAGFPLFVSLYVFFYKKLRICAKTESFIKLSDFEYLEFLTSFLKVS